MTGLGGKSPRVAGEVGSPGHGWPDEAEPAATQQSLLGIEPAAGSKPPKRAPRNGKRWKLLLDKFAEGAGERFIRDDKLVDRGAIVSLNRLVDDLRAAAVTQADVRRAGELVLSLYDHPVTARWLMKPGNLMDMVARSRAGDTGSAKPARRFKVR